MDSQMLHKEQRFVVHSHMSDTYRDNIARDALNGLTAPQKYIPSKYFYDAHGSELFEKICHLPEYYPTRTELSILRDVAPRIMSSFNNSDLVELGSGANWKIKIFLDAAGFDKLNTIRYVPVDVSKTALVNASEELLRIYPGLEIVGIVADFMSHLEQVPSDRPRLILFLGSTIGNLDVQTRDSFLSMVAASMNEDDRFLIGFDMLKPKAALEAAYNDSLGVTSKFNKNILNVLNRELNANFDPFHFRHIAFFNEEEERVEMHLQAKKNLEVIIDDLGLVVEMDKNETIHTEICNKFSKRSVEKMVHKAGFEITQWFFDDIKWFSLTELALRDR